jgi:hypothetical protein
MASNITAQLQTWIDARKRHHLSHSVVQMARELGLNPHKLGKIDNRKQEFWKAPLSEFITSLYEKRFGRQQPESVLSIEQIADWQAAKKKDKRMLKPAKCAQLKAENPGKS